MKRPSPTTGLSSRPFTALEHNTRDLSGLETSRAILRNALSVGQAAYTQADRQTHEEALASGAKCRTVLYRPDVLQTHTEFGFVGFCAIRKQPTPEALFAEMTRLDGELLDALLDYPDVLSYSSYLLPDGDYINLVMLTGLDAIARWRSSPTHRYAAEVLSPNYYHHIRIHNGTIEGGLNGALTLLSTKYYDYAEQPVWHSVRDAKQPK
jgi:hypothetical protein